MRDHHAVARARVDELTIADVDTHVRDAGSVRREEHEISGLHRADDAVARVVLGIGRTRHGNAEHCKNVLDVTRAVKTRRARTTEDIRRSEEPQRAPGELLSDLGGAGEDASGKTADFAGLAVMGRGVGPAIEDEMCRPRFDVRALDRGIGSGNGLGGISWCDDRFVSSGYTHRGAEQKGKSPGS